MSVKSVIVGLRSKSDFVPVDVMEEYERFEKQSAKVLRSYARPGYGSCVRMRTSVRRGRSGKSA